MHWRTMGINQILEQKLGMKVALRGVVRFGGCISGFVAGHMIGVLAFLLFLGIDRGRFTKPI